MGDGKYDITTTEVSLLIRIPIAYISRIFITAYRALQVACPGLSAIGGDILNLWLAKCHETNYRLPAH